MVRKSRRNFILFQVVFVVVLFFLVVPGIKRSTNKTFAWTKVRYTSAAAIPPARGICAGLKTSSKPALVVARIAAEDTKWLDGLAHLYHPCIYTADAPANPKSTHLQVPANRGHEAMAYLTFLIDNYESIPTAGAVFVHGSRFAWHNDDPNYDNAALLASLNVSAATEPTGYHSLRCDWSAGTCDAAEAVPQGSVETTMRVMLEPWNKRAASDAALPRSLAAIFGDDARHSPSESVAQRVLLKQGDAVRAQCCAQFVASREAIWQHSRGEYIALRQWLLDGSHDDRDPKNLKRKGLSGIAPRDDYIAGRILSYLWHVLFTDMSMYSSGVDLDRLNAMACPRADDCYCRLYGRCDLDGCTSPGKCRGQYHVPKGFKLPDDWALRHT